MRPRSIHLCFFALALCLVASSAFAQAPDRQLPTFERQWLPDPPKVRSLTSLQVEVQQASGQTATGAFYSFSVPDGWQPGDGLVIWNHGFDLNPIGPDPSLGPLVDVQLSQGYAVAASSYSQIGWALFQSVEDMEQMYAAFASQFGDPGPVFVYGASLGGAITAQLIEEADLGNVVGAMPICGAVAGSRTWDGGLDVRLLYDLICSDVPGAAVPGGITGLAFPPDPTFDDVALATAVNICMGADLPARTPEQQARLDRFLALTAIPQNFVTTDMFIATFGLFDLTFDPGKLAGAVGSENAEVDYGEADANTKVTRVSADPAARERLLDNQVPSGKVGDVKIVSIHTDKDGLIIVENQTDYAAKVPAQNLSIGVIVEDTPTHCGFTDAETIAAWESLRGWVAGLPKPGAGDMQAACEQIVGGGLAAGPCRYDPNYVLGSYEARVRPRAVCMETDTALCLADGRFRVEVTWTDFDGLDGVGTTVPQTTDTGAFWFFNAANLEMMIKVLDGRQSNGNFWVFYGSLTNVEFTLTVTDTITGEVKVYENPLGNFASVGDTSAL